MNFANPLFIILCSVGIIFIIAGWILLKFPPKKINSLYGYRTKRSMKSQDRWEFAQVYSAKEMIKNGFLMFLISLSGLTFHFSERLMTVFSLAVMMFFVIYLLLKTEKKLKEQFED